MSEDSFEDEFVASIMNRHFVCIKVDREERPDVDLTYLEVIRMFDQSAGWPLHLFCLSDGRPFWGGTYFRNKTRAKESFLGRNCSSHIGTLPPSQRGTDRKRSKRRGKPRAFESCGPFAYGRLEQFPSGGCSPHDLQKSRRLERRVFVGSQISVPDEDRFSLGHGRVSRRSFRSTAFGPN